MDERGSLFHGTALVQQAKCDVLHGLTDLDHVPVRVVQAHHTLLPRMRHRRMHQFHVQVSAQLFRERVKVIHFKVSSMLCDWCRIVDLGTPVSLSKSCCTEKPPEKRHVSA